MPNCLYHLIVSAKSMNVYIAIVIFCLGSALVNAASIESFPDHEALSQEMVDYINLKAKTTWKVKSNCEPDTCLTSLFSWEFQGLI